MSIQETIEEARNQIENIRNIKVRNALKYQYLSGTRISEVAGKYGIRVEDLTLTKYKDRDIALFSQRTAKKKGRVRVIALPLDSDIWVKQILDYFQERKKGPVFSITDRSIQLYARKAFSGISYLVEDYKLSKELEIEEHNRQAITHYLRKLRHTYLIVIKGFSEAEGNIFFGWTTQGIGKRYMVDLWLQWSIYIDKLL